MDRSLVSINYQELMSARQQALQVELARIFPSAAEFVCEMGSGHGHFLTAYAQQHKEFTCIGLDIIADRVARAERKRDRAGLRHLHFLHAEARLFLECLPRLAKISAVLILFPDPWPKTRHHKHRILQTEFLAVLRQHVSPNARLYFRTDDSSYFEHAESTVRNHPDWELTGETLPFEHETVFQKRASVFYSFAAKPRP